MIDKLFLREKLKEFLIEDIGVGDITTDSLDIDRTVESVIIAKEKGVIAGVDFAVEVFKILDPNILMVFKRNDGDYVNEGDTVLKIKGSGSSILKGERVALNLLQRLSGIATNTKKYVERISDLKTKLLDTRKTTPGFRAFEKYAVKVGGGSNHRFALYDMVMIKDNHISLSGGIKKAVERVKEKVSPMVKIEVEVSSIDQIKEILDLDIDIVMLDNMSVDGIKESLNLIDGRFLTEASGNITLENIREVALTGVNFISSGSIIHSSRWLDLSLRII
ncbi:carboxylating nicotinate-nucleotide diphosphorylase [Persephonella sp.]